MTLKALAGSSSYVAISVGAERTVALSDLTAINANIEVVHRNASGAAPDGVTYRIVSFDDNTEDMTPDGVYDPRRFVEAYWDFGDSFATDYTAPLAIPSDFGQSSNDAIGYQTTHVFTGDGTFTATVSGFTPAGVYFEGQISTTVGRFEDLVDPRTPANATQVIKVGTAPDAEYPTIAAMNAATSLLTSSGSNTRPHIIELSDNFYEELERVEIRRRGNIMFRSADKNAVIRIALNDGSSNEIINHRGVAAGFPADFILNGVTLNAGYDPATNISTPARTNGTAGIDGLRIDGDIGLAPTGIVLVDSLITNCYAGITFITGQDEEYSRLTAHNTTFAKCGNYSVFSTATPCAYLGCDMATDPDGTTGWGQTTTVNRQHGNHRGAGARWVYTSKTYMRSYAGWFVNVLGITTPQSTNRNNTSGAENVATLYTQTVLEGGFQIYAHETQNTTTPVTESIATFLDCAMIGTALTRSMFKAAYGGLYAKGCLFIFPRALSYVNNAHFDYRTVVEMDDDTAIAAGSDNAKSAPIILRDNTVIDADDLLGANWLTDGTLTGGVIDASGNVILKSADLTQFDGDPAVAQSLFKGIFQPNGTGDVAVIDPRDTSNVTLADQFKIYGHGFSHGGVAA